MTAWGLLLWQPAVKDMRSRVCRSTLADANEVRDWRIYADLAALLIKKARRLYSGQQLDVDLHKCNEGRLSLEERDEYEALIRVGNFVAILQAKARRLLAEGHAA